MDRFSTDVFDNVAKFPGCHKGLLDQFGLDFRTDNFDRITGN
jgi:hypothetical protein